MPLFVHRFARERLRALGQIEGAITKQVPEVLFVCVQNAGRSQMAAGLLDKLAAGRVHVRSAGSEPANQINPVVREAMAEVGVDLDREFPKRLADEIVRAADAVITMGCGDACPIHPGKRYEDWDFDDPANEDLDGVRRIRDQIRGRIVELLAEVAPAERVRCFAASPKAPPVPTRVGRQGWGWDSRRGGTRRSRHAGQHCAPGGAVSAAHPSTRSTHVPWSQQARPDAVPAPRRRGNALEQTLRLAFPIRPPQGHSGRHRRRCALPVPLVPGAPQPPLGLRGSLPLLPALVAALRTVLGPCQGRDLCIVLPRSKAVHCTATGLLRQGLALRCAGRGRGGHWPG